MKRITLFFAIVLVSNNIQAQTLLGLANGGGKDNYGVLFSYDILSHCDSNIISFTDTSNGTHPYYGGLSSCRSGLFYGTTLTGGKNNLGTLFSYNTIQKKDSLLFSFDSPTGEYPSSSSLIQANNGMLYGMTTKGGNGVLDYGAMYSFDPSSNTYSVLFDFNDTLNGSYPYGGLIQATNGLLYGMTYEGGTSGSGTLFSYNIATGKDSVLLNFNGINGSQPYGSLMQASDGMMYGMTYGGGGSNEGVLFSFNPITDAISTLVDFYDSIGTHPYGNMMEASNGLLYGMTYSGGKHNYGIVFSYDPKNGVDSIVLNFNDTNGRYPYGSLLQASDGMLYGTTVQGGTINEGAVFRLDPVTKKDSIVISFTGPNGRKPYGNLIEIGSRVTGNLSLTNLNDQIKIYPNPTKGELTISLLNNDYQSVEIYNTLGENIYSEVLNTECYNNRLNLSLADQTDGLYVIVVHSSKQISTFKVLLQK